jgi:Tol biopolymer transport system component
MRHVVQRLCALVWLAVVSGCGGGEDKNPIPPGDVVPPAAVTTLEVTSAPGRDVTLSWRSPGDDGTEGTAREYHIRYAADSLSEATWAAATPVTPTPAPEPAGRWVDLAITGLPLGTWYFGLKAADEASNWSDLSNIVRAAVADVTPPERVDDLTVVSAGRDRLTLTWTAPASDGPAGRANEYDLRYSAGPISASNWGDATRVLDLPAPGAAGAVDSATVSGLAEATTYHLALRSADESGNWSGLSNVVVQPTASRTLRQLTFSGAGRSSMGPSWSPDGTQIAFSAGSYDSGDIGIYRIPVSGGAAVRLSHGSAIERWPAWSPDGTKIAFCSKRSGRWMLWVMDAADGSNADTLANLEAESNFYFGLKPAWSPSGERIAYVTGADTGMNYSPSSIYFIPAAGGDRELFVDSPEWRVNGPTWSPDGSRIAYELWEGLREQILIRSLSGGEPVPLGGGPARQSYPAWSPDGTVIAYSSGSGTYRGIWTMPVAGGEPRLLVPGTEYNIEPAWSPDGRELAFASSRTGKMEIWILRLEE